MCCWCILREVGAAPVAPSQPRDAVQEVLDGYRRYLLGERGLAEKTFARYELDVRLFLGRLAQRPQGLDLQRLDAADVRAFLAAECRARSIEGPGIWLARCGRCWGICMWRGCPRCR